MRRIKQPIRPFGLSLLLLAATGCATAPSEELPESGDAVNLERIVCHESPSTGSRLVTKTCKTQREWEADAEESKEINRKLQRDTAPRSDLPAAGG
jgi:hypothetical protein